MRRLMLFIAIGICLTLLGGSMISYAAGCAAEKKAKDDAKNDLTKALLAQSKAKDALAKATAAFMDASRDFITASGREGETVADDVIANNNWEECIESSWVRDCSVLDQMRQRVDKRLAKAMSDVARASERMASAKKAMDDAVKAEQAEDAKEKAAWDAYKAARDRYNQCVQKLPKTPAPKPARPKGNAAKG